MELCMKYNRKQFRYFYGECPKCNTINSKGKWNDATRHMHWERWREKQDYSNSPINPSLGEKTSMKYNVSFECPACYKVIRGTNIKLIKADAHPNKGGEYCYV